MKTQKWVLMVLAVTLALMLLWGCQALIKPEEPEARSYNTACYQEQGGARWVCGDGGELAVLDGARLDVAGDADFTGATVTGFAPSALGSNVTITGNLIVSGTANLVGSVSSSTGAVTITDGVLITSTLEVDGAATFDGATDFNAAMNVDANGDFDSLSTLAIDSDSYYDSTGDMIVNDNLDITGTLQYGANDLYPLGVGVSGFQIGFGSVTVTGTVTATHTTGTPYAVLCTLETWSIDTAYCVALGTTGVITATVYDITGSESTTPVQLNWLAIGMP
jgi:hypothetical protein